MSGAELKVRMTGLGLPANWLAKQCDVYTKTVIRWYQSDRVPAKAVAEMNRISAITSREMHHMIRDMGTEVVFYTEYANRESEGCSEVNALPASWHRALTYRVLEYALTQNVNATVAYTPEGSS